MLNNRHFHEKFTLFNSFDNIIQKGPIYDSILTFESQLAVYQTTMLKLGYESLPAVKQTKMSKFGIQERYQFEYDVRIWIQIGQSDLIHNP